MNEPAPVTIAGLDWNRPFLIGVAAIAVLWLSFCIMVSWQRWENFDIGIDTAAWAQTLENGLSGGGWSYTCYPDSELLVPRRFYSIHFYNFLWVLSPVFAVFRHPLTLYFLQHVAHALGGIAVAILAWRRSRQDAAFALLMMVAFFLHPAHARAQTAFDVNPRHYALLFVPVAALAQSEGGFRLSLFFLGLLAAGEENLGLAAAFLSWTFALRDREHRSGYSMAGLVFCCYTVLVLKVGLRSFLGEGFEIHFASRYAHLWEGPWAWLTAVFRVENLNYLLTLLAPLLLVNLLRPGAWWIAAIPFLGQNLLSFEGDVRLIGHHYTSPLSAVLFLGALDGLFRENPSRRRGIALLAVATCFVLAVSWYPSLPYLWEGVDGRTRELATNLRPVVKLIGPSDSVSAPPAVCAHLWARPRLWFFPNGRQEAEWIVFPKYLPGYPAFSDSELRTWLASASTDRGLRKVEENPDVILFRRTAESP